MFNTVESLFCVPYFLNVLDFKDSQQDSSLILQSFTCVSTLMKANAIIHKNKGLNG